MERGKIAQADESLDKLPTEELVGRLRALVYRNGSMDSYGILAALVGSGWTYDEKKFHDILGKLRAHPMTIRLNGVDMYMQCQPLSIDAKLADGGKRRNCYECDFLCRCEDAYRMKILYGKQHGIDIRDARFCALDPTLEIRLGMDLIPKLCPVNLALAKAAGTEEGKEQRNDG